MYPPKASSPAKWSTGLFACAKNPSNCCLTCFCPCITFGQIAEIVDEGSTSCALSGAVYGTLFYLGGLSCFYVMGLPCCYSCFYRKRIRARFNLEKTCPDWLVHCFCGPCALCQEYRELQNRGFDPALGWIGNQHRGTGTTMSTPPVNPNMAR